MKRYWSSCCTWGTVVIYGDGWMRIHVCFGIYHYLTTNLFFTWLIMVWLCLANLSFHFIWNRLRAYTYTILRSCVIFIHDLFSDNTCLFLVRWTLDVSVLLHESIFVEASNELLITFSIFVSRSITSEACRYIHGIKNNLLF